MTTETPPLLIELRPDLRAVVARMAHGRANALGPTIIDALDEAVDVAEREGALTLVVASALPGFFAAGADIKHMTSLDAAGFAAFGAGLRATVERIAAFDGVTVAAIDGLALGGGLELAMACGLRFATPLTRLGVPEVKIGLIPGAGGTQRLPRLVGPDRALEIAATGRQVGAEEALRIGLITELVDDAEARALALAAELAAVSGPAVRSVVRCTAAADRPLREGLRFEADEIDELFVSGEAAEGLSAFVERRPPVFEA